MLRLAFFISAVCHLAVLLSIRNLALLLPPATDQVSQIPRISAQLISRADQSAWAPPSASLVPPPLSSAGGTGANDRNVPQAAPDSKPDPDQDRCNRLR